MKKLLTVLLVIAVICTFSFGSAFAAEEVTYHATVAENELLTWEAFVDTYANGSNDTIVAANTGNYGITETLRDYLLDNLEDLLDWQVNFFLTVTSDHYYGVEKAKAKAAVETAIEAVKTATTANAAVNAYAKAWNTLIKLVPDKTVEQYLNVISNTNVAFNSTLLGGSAPDYYLLPGYGYVKNFATLSDASMQAVEKTMVAKWFVDNGYRTAATAKAHVADFQAALVPLTEANTKAIQAEYNAIEAKAVAAAKAFKTTEGNYPVYTAGTYTLEDLNAIYDEIDAYCAKYCFGAYDGQLVTSGSTTVSNTNYFANTAELKTWGTTGFTPFTGIEGYLAYAFAHQYDAEVKAVDLTDKAAVIALYNKIDDLSDTYYGTGVQTSVNTALATAQAAEQYESLATAYEKFKSADVDALGVAFNSFKESTANGGFDFSEKNVAALANARKLFDEFVANYDYDYNFNVLEARILAGEYNQKAAAGFDAKQNKLDQYLNNATVKVTTVKDGKKVTVNAKIDSTSMLYLLKDSSVATVEYKFYHKAPGKSFKFTKTKTVNTITYSKSLKKGKNSFRVGVVLKDAAGKVVAEKSYKASTLGYRTIK